jgi:hypothetical protein
VLAGALFCGARWLAWPGFYFWFGFVRALRFPALRVIRIAIGDSVGLLHRDAKGSSIAPKCPGNYRLSSGPRGNDQRDPLRDGPYGLTRYVRDDVPFPHAYSKRCNAKQGHTSRPLTFRWHRLARGQEPLLSQAKDPRSREVDRLLGLCRVLLR